MLDLVQCASWYAAIDGPVLEVGSRVEVNQEHLDLRRAFPRGTPYLGVDVIDGPGVDRVVDLLAQAQVDALLADFTPRVTLCLYVLEHVWDVQGAARALAKIWLHCPDSWLLVSTHQRQSYHGTDKYPDYWRLTATGMRRLMEEAGVDGVHVLVSPDSSDPEDVLAIRQPATLPWPEDALKMILRAARTRWEQHC